MLKYVDAHCHILSIKQMNDAIAHGVGRFIVNATDPSNWGNVIEISQNENVCGAIGVYPLYVSELPDNWDEKLVECLGNNSDLMVGEIGLDKRYSDMEKQIAVFTRQLQIAHDMGRVANIHIVGAWGKCMDVLRGVKLPPAMVFHAFSGAPELIRELIGMGAYFSFGPDICNTQHKQMRASVVAVPESRILTESDAPHYLAPDAVPNAVTEIAHLRRMSVENMAEIIYNNATRLLNGGTV